MPPFDLASFASWCPPIRLPANPPTRRAIAHARLGGGHAPVTLRSTELVHEAYMRLGVGDGKHVRMASGVYFLRLETDRDRGIHKVIVVR